MVWSRNFSTVERRVNKKNLYFTQFDPYERCCTFDGPDYAANTSNNNLFYN